MSYTTEGHAGTALERRTAIPEFQTGLRARSTDSQDWIYVRASGAVGVGPCKVLKVGADWVVTSNAGTFTNPAAFADGQYGWVRQAYYLPDEAAEVAYDDTVTNWGVSSLQGAIEYIFANFTPSSPSLNSLTDVEITSPQDGQALVYDFGSGLWINQALTLSLDDLSDVSTTGAANGKIIRHNGTQFVIADQNDHTHTLSQITDAGTLAGLSSVGTSQIANSAITFAKIQDMGQGTLIGRYTASTGAPQAVTISTGLTLNSGTGNLTANVQSVHGRTGAVVAAVSDYDASQVDNDSGVTGSTVKDALDWLLANKAALSHTHTSTAITDFAEAVDDRVGALLVAGTNITLTYNDGANTLTIAASGGGGVSDGDKGDITVSSSGATWTIDNDAVTFAKMQNVTTDRLLGRDTAGGGDTEEISLSTGLEFTGSAGIRMTANQREVAITFVIDGGGATITTGIKGDLEIPFACTVQRATALADQSGSIVVDVWKDTYANFPPVDADSITASAPITISSATKSQDSTLTGWTTAIAAGDILRFNVDSVSSIQRATISLKVTKT